MRQQAKSSIIARLTAVTSLLLLLISTSAPAANVSGYHIIEGVGINDVITLGMSRTAVIAAQNAHSGDNGNCHSGSSCSFRLSTDSAAVTVNFDGNNAVHEITINQSNVRTQWPMASLDTVIDNMTLSQVSALYSGSVIEGNRVVVEDLGYSYSYTSSCFYGQCSRSSSHHIYGNGDITPPEPEITNTFEGDIVVRNQRRKTRTLNIHLEFTHPDGKISRAMTTARIKGRSSITLAPEQFLDIEGALGTYYYTARATNKRGRTWGRSSGSVRLVAGN